MTLGKTMVNLQGHRLGWRFQVMHEVSTQHTLCFHFIFRMDQHFSCAILPVSSIAFSRQAHPVYLQLEKRCCDAVKVHFAKISRRSSSQRFLFDES